MLAGMWSWGGGGGGGTAPKSDANSSSLSHQALVPSEFWDVLAGSNFCQHSRIHKHAVVMLSSRKEWGFQASLEN